MIAKISIARSNQQGVTLLLALLVLSSILAIAFSLATIMFVEIRSSGDLQRSETSYYGADAVGEQAIYNVAREVDTNSTGQCDASLPNCYSTSVGNAVISSTTVSSVADPIQQDSVPLSTGLDYKDGAYSFNSNAKFYYLFDPSCPAPLDSSDPADAAIITAKPYCQYGGSGYSKISLTYLSSGNSDPVVAYLCEFDPRYTIGTGLSTSYSTVPCTDPTAAAGYWQGIYNGSFSLTPGNSPYCWGATCPGGSHGDLDPNKQQELILFQPDTNTTGPVYVQLQTYNSSGQPQGIPYYQKTGVTIAAQQGSVNRRLQVVVPNGGNGGGSPLFLVNNGGGSYADSQGRSWSDDSTCSTYGAAKYNTFSVGSSISGTSDQALYQDSCWAPAGKDMSYSFSVPNGSHTVTLKFAETSDAAAGARQFNIIVNGVTEFTNYDIFARAGGKFIAHDEVIPVTATTGTITIQLTHGAADNPTINAIEID